MLTTHKSHQIVTSDNKITGEWVARWLVNGVYHMQAGFATEAQAQAYAQKSIDRETAINAPRQRNYTEDGDCLFA